MPRHQGNISDAMELSEESKRLWVKMLMFKKRFDDNESKNKSLEETLANVNLELSLLKRENSRLNEKVEEQRTSISKYQQILKDLVEVEDRYCKLLVEKKRSDEELSTEKKLRLELQTKWNQEKAELQKSLQDELNILKEHSASKESSLKSDYSKIIEEQKLEIDSLNHQVLEARKKHEEDVSKVKQDLMRAQREITKLRSRPSGQENLTIVNNVTLKPIVQEGSMGNISQGREVVEVDMIPSRSLEYIFEEQPQEEVQSSRTHLRRQPPFQTNSVLPSSEQHVPGARRDYRIDSCPNKPPSESARTYQQDSEPPVSRKFNTLEVFRVPSRIPKRSPIKKKRKLYSRSDDTI